MPVFYLKMFFLGLKNRLIRGLPVAQCKLPLPDKCLGKRYINKGVCYVLVQARQQVFMVCPHKALKFTVFSSVVLESYFKNYYTAFSPSLCCYTFLLHSVSLLQVTPRKLLLNSQRMILPTMVCLVFLKVAFFQKGRFVFQISKSQKTKYSKKLS